MLCADSNVGMSASHLDAHAARAGANELLVCQLRFVMTCQRSPHHCRVCPVAKVRLLVRPCIERHLQHEFRKAVGKAECPAPFSKRAKPLSRSARAGLQTVIQLSQAFVEYTHALTDALDRSSTALSIRMCPAQPTHFPSGFGSTCPDPRNSPSGSPPGQCASVCASWPSRALPAPWRCASSFPRDTHRRRAVAASWRRRRPSESPRVEHHFDLRPFHQPISVALWPEFS